jgi:PEP-CTERM motif
MYRTSLLALAALCVLALALPAQADEIQWGYTSTLAGPGATTGSSTFAISADPTSTGSVLLTGDSHSNGMGSSDIVPVAVTVQNPSAANNVSHGAYSLFITINDASNGMSGTLTFNGNIGGSFTTTSAALLTNSFTNPNQTLTLGHDVFTVSITGFVQPSPIGASTTGSIGAHVEVGSVNQAPEPSTLILGFFGVAGGVFGWRRRVRRATV